MNISVGGPSGTFSFEDLPTRGGVLLKAPAANPVCIGEGFHLPAARGACCLLQRRWSLVRQAGAPPGINSSMQRVRDRATVPGGRVLIRRTDDVSEPRGRPAATSGRASAASAWEMPLHGGTTALAAEAAPRCEFPISDRPWLAYPGNLCHGVHSASTTSGR